MTASWASFPAAPMIGRLGYGELRTKTGLAEHRYFVDGGFVQVRDNVVTVLTSRALPAEAIDPVTAVRELEAAGTKRARTEVEFADVDKALARARGMIRVGSHKG